MLSDSSDSLEIIANKKFNKTWKRFLVFNEPKTLRQWYKGKASFLQENKYLAGMKIRTQWIFPHWFVTAALYFVALYRARKCFKSISITFSTGKINGKFWKNYKWIHLSVLWLWPSANTFLLFKLIQSFQLTDNFLITWIMCESNFCWLDWRW